MISVSSVVKGFRWVRNQLRRLGNQILRHPEFLDTFLDAKLVDSKSPARNPGIPGMFPTRMSRATELKMLQIGSR